MFGFDSCAVILIAVLCWSFWCSIPVGHYLPLQQWDMAIGTQLWHVSVLGYMVMAYIDMTYIVMVYIVMVWVPQLMPSLVSALPDVMNSFMVLLIVTYGLYSHSLYSHGLYRYGLYRYGLQVWPI